MVIMFRQDQAALLSIQLLVMCHVQAGIVENSVCDESFSIYLIEDSF